MLRIVIGVILGFAVSALGGKVLIPFLRRMKAGQSIKEIGPTWHMSKQGTPTMGGLMFIFGTIVMVAVLLGLLFGWTFSAEGMTVHRLTLFFSTFVFFQFWNMFNAKGFETHHSVFTCLKGCREFFLILLAIAVGQVLVVEFGGEVFRTTPLPWQEWAVVIALTSLLAFGGEAVRALLRRKMR